MVMIGAFLVSISAPLAFAADDNISKLIVQGEGKVTAVPDKATVILGVETRGPSAIAAATENAQLMNETITALLNAGISSNEIQTSSFSLSTVPQEEPIGSGGAENKARDEKPQFIASNIVTANLNNTTDVGRVLDAAVSAGSNSIQDVSFDLKDPKLEKDQALTLAIEDARRKAEIAAKAAGVDLGKLLEINEGYGYVGLASKGASFDIATPISPGNMEITASVTLTYEIS
jgi:uncharacterized protein YggE